MVPPPDIAPTPETIHTDDEHFVIEAPEEDIIEENLASKLVADFGLSTATLDLSNNKYPTIDLLKEHLPEESPINQEELEENKKQDCGNPPQLQNRNSTNKSHRRSIGNII